MWDIVQEVAPASAFAIIFVYVLLQILIPVFFKKEAPPENVSFLSTQASFLESQKECLAKIDRTIDTINNTTQKLEERLGRLEIIIDTLYSWHNVRDEDGVFRWWVKKSLENNITQLITYFRSESEFLKKISEAIVR